MRLAEWVGVGLGRGPNTSWNNFPAVVNPRKASTVTTEAAMPITWGHDMPLDDVPLGSGVWLLSVTATNVTATVGNGH